MLRRPPRHPQYRFLISCQLPAASRPVFERESMWSMTGLRANLAEVLRTTSPFIPRHSYHILPKYRCPDPFRLYCRPRQTYGKLPVTRTMSTHYSPTSSDAIALFEEVQRIFPKESVGNDKWYLVVASTQECLSRGISP